LYVRAGFVYGVVQTMSSPVQTGDKGSERSNIDISGHLISYTCINYNRVHSSLLACYAVSTSKQLPPLWRSPIPSSDSTSPWRVSWKAWIWKHFFETL